MTLRHEIVRPITFALVRAIRALGAACAMRIAGMAKNLRHRRDLEFLARLDDRQLRDIGLTRSDVRFALSEPLWRDPGAVLISRLGQRGTGRTVAASVPSIVPGQAAGRGARALGAPGRGRRRAA